MPIAIAILSKAFALKSHAIPSRTFPKLLRTTEKLSRTFLALAIKSPIPLMAFEILLIALEIVTAEYISATIEPPANNLPQSIFPATSLILSHTVPNAPTIFSPTPVIASITAPMAAFMPLINPCMKLVPASSAITEGECSPRASLNDEMKLVQKLTILVITSDTLPTIPF